MKKNLYEIIEQCNSIIAKRTKYGLYDIIIPKKGNFCILDFSNKSGWNINVLTQLAREFREKGIYKHTVDSNYILVPYSKKIVEKVMPSLDPLPLYKNSYEAKQKKSKKAKNILKTIHA